MTRGLKIIIIDLTTYTNWDGNSRSEDMVEGVIHNSNMLGEMIGLMIHNKENMVSKAIRDQHQIDSIQNLDKQYYCYEKIDHIHRNH